MRSLSWYIKRASVMHPREVFHRIGEHVVLARLRREHRFGETRPKEVERPNDFQFCTETSDQLPALSWNFDPTDDRIHQLLQGQWSALGFPGNGNLILTCGAAHRIPVRLGQAYFLGQFLTMPETRLVIFA